MRTTSSIVALLTILGGASGLVGCGLIGSTNDFEERLSASDALMLVDPKGYDKVWPGLVAEGRKDPETVLRIAKSSNLRGGRGRAIAILGELKSKSGLEPALTVLTDVSASEAEKIAAISYLPRFVSADDPPEARERTLKALRTCVTKGSRTISTLALTEGARMKDRRFTTLVELFLRRYDPSGLEFTGKTILEYAEHDPKGVRVILKAAEKKAGEYPGRLSALVARIPL